MLNIILRISATEDALTFPDGSRLDRSSLSAAEAKRLRRMIRQIFEKTIEQEA